VFYLFLSFYARLSVSIVTLPSSFPLFTCASSIQMIMNHMPLCLVVLFFSHFIVLLLFFERNKWRWRWRWWWWWWWWWWSWVDTVTVAHSDLNTFSLLTCKFHLHIYALRNKMMTSLLAYEQQKKEVLVKLLFFHKALVICSTVSAIIDGRYFAYSVSKFVSCALWLL